MCMPTTLRFQFAVTGTFGDQPCIFSPVIYGKWKRVSTPKRVVNKKLCTCFEAGDVLHVLFLSVIVSMSVHKCAHDFM